MGIDNLDFNEDRARQGARMWGEVAAKLGPIIDKADGIKGQPWGSDDKIAKAFADGEDGFIKVRDTIVAIAKNNLKPAIGAVQGQLDTAATKYIEQATSRTRKP